MRRVLVVLAALLCFATGLLFMRPDPESSTLSSIFIIILALTSLFALAPFAYLPIFLGAVTIASRTGPLVVLADLVIDPGAVHAGFWAWSGGGLYYGVPPVNFAGWAATGILYGAVLFLLAGKEKVPAKVTSSLFLIIALWSGYDVENGLIIPGTVGLLATYRGGAA